MPQEKNETKPVLVYSLLNGDTILGAPHQKDKGTVHYPRKVETQGGRSLQLFALLGEPHEIHLEMGYFWYETQQEDLCKLYWSTVPPEDPSSNLIIPSKKIRLM